MSRVSRRTFLLQAAAAGAALALGPRGPLPAAARWPAQRVVHTHNPAATYWDYSTGWYGDYVDQAAVNALTDRGVMALTETGTVAAAWQALLPAYGAGQKVAIKINLNNAGGGCGESGQIIDALPQPVNAVIRGLKLIGVAESDIRVYDVTNGWHQGQFPSRIIAKITALYPGVEFHAFANQCSLGSGYSATQAIHFNVPPGKPAISDRPICNALAGADYLINMPIMKKHGMAGVTLGFKNHFGSFESCPDVHWSIELTDPYYTPAYSGLIDIWANPHFGGKTVLTVGDGLYGARIDNYSEIPSPWPTWGNQSPNSLFFSTDPVAIDCVMYDFLDWEGGVPAGSDDYLRLAEAAGFGTFEHWDAGHQYHAIDYHRYELGLPPRVYLPLVRGGQ